MEDFKIVTLQTLTVPRDDDEMLHRAEATAIATLRAQGFELQNHNAPRLVTSPWRREQMRQWRLAHPGYMSAAGKRHYRLRKARAQAMAAVDQVKGRLGGTECTQLQVVGGDGLHTDERLARRLQVCCCQIDATISLRIDSRTPRRAPTGG